MNNPLTSNEDRGGSVLDGDSDALGDDDPIAEVHRIRRELFAEFDFDLERYFAGGQVLSWAIGAKFVSVNPPRGPYEVELPEDLTGLIPNRERFIESVRRARRVHAEYEPDLKAYNEDGRRRARVLGFPEESFVVTPSDCPPGINE